MLSLIDLKIMSVDIDQVEDRVSNSTDFETMTIELDQFDQLEFDQTP